MAFALPPLPLAVVGVISSPGEARSIYIARRPGDNNGLIFVKAFARAGLLLDVDGHPALWSAKHLAREEEALRRLSLIGAHPFVVEYRFAMHEEHRLHLGMEHLPNGDVCDLLLARGEGLPEAWARIYAIEVALALGHVHSHDIMHRDVKPENVLIAADGHVKLSDFGACKKLNSRVGNAPPPPRPCSLCGTPDYIAPEIFRGVEACETCDWWSLGCLVYEMITGRSLFDFPDLTDLIHAALRFDELPPETAHLMGPALSAFLMALLVPEPNQRLGARPHGHQAVVEHPWFEGLDAHAVLRKQVPAPVVPPPHGALGGAFVPPAPLVDPVTIHAQGQAVAQAGGAWLDYSAPHEQPLIVPHLATAFAQPTSLLPALAAPAAVHAPAAHAG